MAGLGILPSYEFSTANQVSADGSVVVGFSAGDYDPMVFAFTRVESFIWDTTNGMRSVNSALTGLGVNLTGWTLLNATGVSADGLTLVGNGRNPNGADEAWIAYLGETGTAPINPILPTPAPENPNAFHFPLVQVPRLIRRFFDPPIAVGYDYSVTGGPLFASVEIPGALAQGDSQFTLELPGFGNYSLLAGTPFDLLTINPLGFSNFRISGIDIAEMLDPTNTLAFVTGLGFTEAGTVNVTQTPIVQDVASTPEPSSLLGLGLLSCGLWLKKRKAA
jgi:hypothetical protein